MLPKLPVGTQTSIGVAGLHAAARPPCRRRRSRSRRSAACSRPQLMELALESRRPCCSGSSAANAASSKAALTAFWQSSKLPRTPNTPTLLAALRDHLLALDVGDAVVGVEDDDAACGRGRRSPRAPPCRCRRDVATRMRKSSVELAALLLALDRLAEEQRHALQRHVLERARGAVPQLEHVHVRRRPRRPARCAGRPTARRRRAA